MRLTKHVALGNDFLVALDEPAPPDGWAAAARRLCDRRRGVGADGLLVGTTSAEPGTDVDMLLFNADGSRAEMSGNGIRCLVQAWVARHGAPRGTVRVRTDGGHRDVEVLEAGPDTLVAAVAMGAVVDLDPPTGWAALGCDPRRPVAHLGLGNPHTVVAVDDVAAVDLAGLGARVPEVNLEIVAPGPGDDAITMRVHERGVGLTQACGTGACAAAWAAVRWGLVRPGTTEVTVHMPGGDARVRLGAEPVLVGPATFVAVIEVP